MCRVRVELSFQGLCLNSRMDYLMGSNTISIIPINPGITWFLKKPQIELIFFNILIKFDPAPPLSCFFSLFNLCSSLNFVLHLTFLPVFLFLSVPLTYLLVLNLTLLSSAFPLLCEFSKFLYSLSLFFL